MHQEDPLETTTNSQVDPKIVAILAYIALVGWIVAMVLNNPKSELGSFHLRQALGVHALSAAVGIVAIVPVLGWIAAMVAGFAAFIFWIIGLLGAIEGRKRLIPFIGEQVQEWFHAI